MNDLRVKIAAFALVLGLGGLGGYAMSSNRSPAKPVASTPTPTTQVIRRTVHVKPKHTAPAAGPPRSGSPAASQASSLTSTPVSTGTSGASSTAPSHSPVQTGSSGGGGGGGGGGGEGGDRGEGGD